MNFAVDKIYNTRTPMTFVAWLELQNTISADVNVNLNFYQSYVKEWSKAHNNTVEREKGFLVSLYVDLIKEITLNFSSEEEKRFLVNFDYTQADNIDIIIPFFVQKLKSICLYYSLKRESLKEKYSVLPYKGTNISISKLVKNLVISNIESGFSQKIIEGRTTLPTLSAVNVFLDVKVEELYDTTNYFDVSYEGVQNLQPASFKVPDIDREIYLDFTNAIKTAIEQYPIFTQSLIGNLSVNLNLSGNELYLLKDRDFINYFNTGSATDLKINLLKKLAPKYSSCSFYYLSTGSTVSDITSGTLFDIKGPENQPTQHLLNNNNQIVATVQSFDSLYTAYELGKFFVPDKLGVLKYNSFNKFYTLEYSKLLPNTVYVFPDPNVVESEESINGVCPFVYKVDVTWNKIGRQDGFRFGDIITDNYYQLFYPYQSYSQEFNTQPLGLSISTDNIDFWSSDESSKWKSEDGLWPDLNKVEDLPINERTKSLLFDSGVMTEWYIDVFGNQVGLYKDLGDNYTQHDKNVKVPGKLYVKETQTGLVSTFNHFFNPLSFKYPSKVIEELKGDIFSFYLIKNTIVVETSSYVVVDSYNYDIDTKQFKNTILPGVYVPKFSINKNLEKFVNSYYVEEEKNLYLCFLKLLPSLSASNYKSICPTIYKINVEDNRVEQVYPLLNFDSTIYSLSSSQYSNFAEIDLRRIEGGKFSYKQKFGLFNLTYCAYNLNDIPFFVNEQFSIAAGIDKLYSYIPILHKPYYYVKDVNFANPNFDLSLRHSATYSEQIGYKDLETFNYTLDKNINDKFHFCSSINPVFINRPGRHFVQFDWSSYVFGNIFFGCQSVGVAKLDEESIIDLRDSSPVVNIREEDKVYKMKDFSFYNKTYTVSAYRPPNTNGTIMTFVVEPSGFVYNDEVFCLNLLSTYKKVSVELRGNGFGKVTSLPFCLNCGDICDFYYPQYSSITLIPSAAPESVFSGWIGSPCQGIASNCLITVTDNITLTAIFNRTPEYTLEVKSNLAGYIPVITNSASVSCSEDRCTAIFKEGEVALLSASVPSGYILSDILGSDCENTAECPIPMTNNLSVTAVYLSAQNTIEIFNIGLDNNTKQAGTVFCSLSPLNVINTYEKFTVGSNTQVILSAKALDTYSFINFAGSPCEANIGNNFCSFNITKNYSISAYYNYPKFSVSTLLSGNGLYYIESSTSREDNEKLDIGTRHLFNTRNKSTAFFLSGEKVTLTAFGVDLSSTIKSEISYLSAYGFETTIIDDSTREIIIPSITSNITVTALSLVDEFNFKVLKTGTGTANTHTVSVKINNGAISTLGPGILSASFVCVPGDIIQITPVSMAPGTTDNLLFVTGSSELYYEYAITSDFALPGNATTFTLKADDYILGGGVFNQSIYNLPAFNIPGAFNLINVDNFSKVTYIPIDDDETISVVYARVEYLEVEKDGVFDALYTEYGIPLLA